jgi:hypothetical protein
LWGCVEIYSLSFRFLFYNYAAAKVSSKMFMKLTPCRCIWLSHTVSVRPPKCNGILVVSRKRDFLQEIWVKNFLSFFVSFMLIIFFNINWMTYRVAETFQTDVVCLENLWILRSLLKNQLFCSFMNVLTIFNRAFILKHSLLH